MFEFFKCVACKKRKKDNNIAKKIHYTIVNCPSRICRIHRSCIGQVLENPSQYSFELIETCINLVKYFEKEHQKQEAFKEKVMSDLQGLNLELFLEKAKGNDIIKA